jgi:hypothetical protein
MKLSYQDLMTGKRKTIKATITTDHPASSYGVPVIVLPDGDALDYGSAIMLDYQVERATQKELRLLEQWQRMAPPFI